MTEEIETDLIINPEWENAPFEFVMIDDNKNKVIWIDGPRMDDNGILIPKFIPRPK